MVIAVPACGYIAAMAMEACVYLFEGTNDYLDFSIGASTFTLLIGGVLATVAPLHSSWRLWLLLPISGVITGVSIAYALKFECFLFAIGFNCPEYTYTETLMLSLPAAAWPVTFCLAVHYGCIRPRSAE